MNPQTAKPELLPHVVRADYFSASTTPDPIFDEIVKSADQETWAKANLAAVRLGWNLAKRVVWSSAVSTPATEPAAAGEAAPVAWRDGEPPHPWNKEWFIAETVHGDRVILMALPEEYSYDYKTADDTYMKAASIKRWMQFPDSEFIPPAAQPLPEGGVDTAIDYPPATGENKKSGWTIDFKFLQAVQKSCEMDVQLEEIESVLLAARSRLSQAAKADEQKLEKAWETIAKPAAEVGDYLFFRAGWECALELNGPTSPLSTVAFENWKKREGRRLSRGEGRDSEYLEAIAANYWDLRCFDIPTGAGDADVGWEVVSHHTSNPKERQVGVTYRDNPREALDAALASDAAQGKAE